MSRNQNMVNISVDSVGVVAVPVKQLDRLIDAGFVVYSALARIPYILDPAFANAILAVPGAFITHKSRN